MASHRPRINKSKPTMKYGLPFSCEEVAFLRIALTDFLCRSFFMTPHGPAQLSDEGRKMGEKLVSDFDFIWKNVFNYGKAE